MNDGPTSVGAVVCIRLKLYLSKTKKILVQFTRKMAFIIKLIRFNLVRANQALADITTV